MIWGGIATLRPLSLYLYEAAYLYVRESLIPVNGDGKCVVAKQIKLGEDTEEM